VVGVQVGVGARIADGLSLGAGFGRARRHPRRHRGRADNAGRFATTSEQQLIASFSPIFGVRYRPSDAWSFGAALRFASKSTYDILITAELGETLPVSIPPLRVAGVAQYDPLVLALEAAFRPSSRWLFSLQLAGERWSQFPLPTFNPVEGMPPQEPPGFHDTVTPRLGVEWGAVRGSWDLTLRGGYSFVMSPAPEMTGAQAFLDNHRNVIAAGIGLGKAPFRVDLWLQTHLLVGRTHDRPEDTPDIETGGTILVGGLMLGVESMRRALLLLLIATPARANPIDAFGFGARSPAMGGAPPPAGARGRRQLLQPGGARGRRRHQDRPRLPARPAAAGAELPRPERRFQPRASSPASPSPATSARCTSPSASPSTSPTSASSAPAPCPRGGRAGCITTTGRSASSSAPTSRSRSAARCSSAAGSATCRAPRAPSTSTGGSATRCPPIPI
jgi:hypothetical protein